MNHKRFISVIRELMESAREFQHYSAQQIRELDLTPAQFDILATLGNTKGMSCKELGEKTLITKGTLTGVLDRMAAKGLLERLPSAEDGRSWVTRLTEKGQAEFEAVFPPHMEYLAKVFEPFTDGELGAMREQLARLRQAFQIQNAVTAA